MMILSQSIVARIYSTLKPEAAKCYSLINQVTVYKCDLTNCLLFQTKHSVLYKETRLCTACLL